ncbi:hypothetical protein ACEZHJ_14440 [Arhodomonas sp. KWT2]|uniref:hypothetical protein n=1 Tax=unclassified Arhodomonas TaxID=2621637 RepID=UPI0013CFD634|nr:hypothetical protein [Arhodomonas sp. KWT]
MQRLVQFPLDNPWLSALFWVVVAVAVLYLARRPARRCIRVGGTGLARGLQRAHAQLSAVRRRLGRTYRRLLVAYVREGARVRTERELAHLEHTIQRDLSGFPHLQQVLTGQLRDLEADYRQTEETPPRPPEWVRAVDSVVSLERPDDPSVARVLDDMHATLERACHNTLQSYRSASHRRHRVIRRMVPIWRRMSRTLETIRGGVERVEGRAAALDRRISVFERLSQRESDPVRRAAGQALVRWIGALLALAVTATAAVTLHALLVRPLNEIGAATGTGPAGIPFSAWLSATFISVTALAGFVLAETTRVTRMVPALGNARTAIRTGFGVLAGTVLALFAVMAGALALTRDYLFALDAAGDALFAGGTASIAPPVFMWTPALVEAGLAFTLSLVVALIPIPLENTLRQGLVAITAAAVALLRVLDAVVRLATATCVFLTRLVLALYDLIVFLPLFVERAVRRRRTGTTTEAPEGAT